MAWEVVSTRSGPGYLDAPVEPAPLVAAHTRLVDVSRPARAHSGESSRRGSVRDALELLELDSASDFTRASFLEAFDNAARTFTVLETRPDGKTFTYTWDKTTQRLNRTGSTVFSLGTVSPWPSPRAAPNISSAPYTRQCLRRLPPPPSNTMVRFLPFLQTP